MEDKRLIYWHLPGFYIFFYMNQIIIKLMKDYPEKFQEQAQVFLNESVEVENIMLG